MINVTSRYFLACAVSLRGERQFRQRQNNNGSAECPGRTVYSCSRYERRLTGQPTKAAVRVARERGERAGNLPFVFQLNADGRRLDASQAEQAVLSILCELRAAGYSLREIAAELNRQGFTTRRGSPWRHQSRGGVR